MTWNKTPILFSPFYITGPALPYGLKDSAMAESPDGRGVLLFGGLSKGNSYEGKILELRAGANSWNILDITLQNPRAYHTVLSLQWFISIFITPIM